MITKIQEEFQSKLHLKVLLVQFDPKYKDVDFNIAKIEKSMELYSKESELDVVFFPEMALSGYVFNSPQEVKQIAEKPNQGKAFNFCSKLASRLNAYVMCGYAEVSTASDKEVFYNSLMVINRDGTLYHNYRKHFLYETDYQWAQSGEQFQTIKLKNLEGKEFKAALAICMDINPKDFKDDNEFALADFCKEEKIDALFFCCAWLKANPKDISKESIKETINYWIYRLYKLFSDGKDKSRYQRKWVLFIANRVGSEGDSVFNGCSCALKANPTELIGPLDSVNEGYLMAEITLQEIQKSIIDKTFISHFSSNKAFFS